MNYKILDNKIVVNDVSQFNIQQILDCGQIFRYYINDVAEVVSGEHYAQVFTFDKHIEIVTKDIEYFVHFFDLERDYGKIKEQLKNDQFLAPAIKFGYGIRILNQNLFEMLVSFIISANNNIKRIKNSLNYLSQKFGSKVCININGFTEIIGSPISQKVNDKIMFYAFPTLEQLKRATVADYVEAGLGYRAEYMYNTIQKLTQDDIGRFINLSENQQLEWLLSLKGVGEKVAHCILLFALHKTSVFPVDTWINKVYNDLTHTTTTNRKEISRELTGKYGNLSGYAQQYFFYYYRSK